MVQDNMQYKIDKEKIHVQDVITQLEDQRKETMRSNLVKDNIQKDLKDATAMRMAIEKKLSQ